MASILIGQGNHVPLFVARTTTGAGAGVKAVGMNRTVQGIGRTTAGAGAATITIEGSNDNSHWLSLGVISLTLSTTDSNDGFVIAAPWQYTRANVTAISGTGANVDVQMGM